MWPAPTFLDACASKLLYIISFNSFRAGLFKERIVYLPYSCLEVPTVYILCDKNISKHY